MQADEALALLDQLLPHHRLSDLQETVFSQVWQGKTYAEIADAYGYEHGYIRDVGFRLWQLISEALGQKVSKSTIKAVLRRYARHHLPPMSSPQRDRAMLPVTLEFPNGPVPLHSPFYIERPPFEAQARAAVLKPGSLIRLKAPRQMGKTSLMQRLLAHAQQHQLRTVKLSLHRADRAIYTNLDRFLRWFCANVSYQLGLDANLDTYWNPDIGSKISCTAYLEDHVLSQINSGLVIALDELNDLFQSPALASEFLPLVRSWYEDAQELPAWQKLRWVLAYATDVYVPLQLNQSPFNVGLAIELPSFSLEQVQDLAQRHGLSWADDQSATEPLVALLRMVSCRPGLVRLALYALTQTAISVEQLLEEAPTQSGIYSDHLRQLLAALLPFPGLQAAFCRVIEAQEPVSLDPISAYRLASLGLIQLHKNQATPSCDLYRRYFLEVLPTDQPAAHV